MTKLEETKKAYDEIIEVYEKNEHLIGFRIDDMKEKFDLHLFGLKLVECGFRLIPTSVTSKDWYNIGENMYIASYGSIPGRQLPIKSDNNEMAEDETFLLIEFPTGPYMFGEDYRSGLFDQFFEELKMLGPKHWDNVNHKLLFTLENSKEILSNFSIIRKKYQDYYDVKVKQDKIKKLQAELEKMKSE